MRHLILVRHAQPQIVLDVPARNWHLSPDGRANCLPLARRLQTYRPSVLASSLEPKAIETADILTQLLGLPVMPVAGLHEHERGSVRELDEEDFEASVAAFFAHPEELVLGVETARQARDRFAGALEGIVRQHPTGDVVVVAHGTVMSLFVAAYTRIEPFPFWKRLRLPDMVALELAPGPRPNPPSV
jgi:broad specificity phosphatase PhoE